MRISTSSEAPDPQPPRYYLLRGLEISQPLADMTPEIGVGGRTCLGVRAQGDGKSWGAGKLSR